MKKTLKHWVSNALAWRGGTEYGVVESSGSAVFRERWDDLYIAVFGAVFDALDEQDDAYLEIGKALELFSLPETRSFFQGIDHSQTMLYAAGFYYLAGFRASSRLLAGLFRREDFNNEMDQFLWSVLVRDLENDRYAGVIAKFFESGDFKLLEKLASSLGDAVDKAFEKSASLYVSVAITAKVVDELQHNNVWRDLDGWGSQEFWRPYILELQRRDFPIWEFFPSQREALHKGLLEPSTTISLRMPTSAGKTSLIELLIYSVCRSTEKKVLFLAPFRALAYELRERFRKLNRFEVTSAAIYGGQVGLSVPLEDVQLLIATPEAFMSMALTEPSVFMRFETVVCDEGHLLDSQGRGIAYELMLARFKTVPTPPRFVFLSAVLPNVNEIADWLSDGEPVVASSDYRPTEVEIALLNPTGKRRCNLEVKSLSADSSYTITDILTPDEFRFLNTDTNRKNLYGSDSVLTHSVAVARKALAAGSVVVFAPDRAGKNGVEGVISELLKQLSMGLPLPTPSSNADGHACSALTEYFRFIFGGQYLLTQAAENGALFHHGDLPQQIRELVEDAIRREEVRFVACNTTLAEGVNLPFRTLVIKSGNRFEMVEGQPQYTPIPARDLQNLAGRVGRAGASTRGTVIVANPKEDWVVSQLLDTSAGADAKGYFFNQLERIARQIIDQQLVVDNNVLEGEQEWLLEILDSLDVALIELLEEGLSKSKFNSQVSYLLENTFAYWQAEQDVQQQIAKIVNFRGARVWKASEQLGGAFLKSAATGIRTIEYVTQNIDINAPIWINVNSVTDEDWLSYLYALILHSPVGVVVINNFAEVNESLSIANICLVASLWMKGFTYAEIAQQLEKPVRITLRIIRKLILGSLLNLAQAILTMVEVQLEQEGHKISETVSEWPQFIRAGVDTSSKLWLSNHGIRDRQVVHHLGDWLEGYGVKYEAELVKALVMERKGEVSSLLLSLPAISRQLGQRTLVEALGANISE